MKTTNFAHRTPTFSLSHFPTCLLALLLLAPIGPAVPPVRAAEDLSATLQRGLFEEEANHDLPAAIKAYEAVVNATDAQRKLAGTALFRLAECHRKLGRTNDAVALYQRVQREYPDQTRLADLSRQYVVTTAPAELGRDLGSERVRFLEHEFANRQTEYARIAALYHSLSNLNRPELKNELKKVVPTAAPDPLLNTLQEQRLKAEQRLAELGQSVDANGKAVGSNHPEVKSANASLKTIDKQIEERLDGIIAGIELKAASEKASLDQARKALEEARAGAGAGTPAVSQSARAEQKRLLEEEIKIVEKDLASLEQQRKAGVLAPGELSSKQRELLALRRQVAALDVAPADAAAGSAVTTPTDEEDKEVRRIQALIKDSPDLINAGDQWSSTPLHKAATKGQLVVAKFLLDNKANVNARRQSNMTPLHDAVTGGHKSMTELLIANGAEVNAAAYGEGTPLHIAASRGFRAIVEVLLANKADPNALGPNSSTPLHLAVKKGFKSVIEVLLEAGADVNALEKYASISSNISRDLGTPLHIAVYTGSKPILEMLLARRPDVNLESQLGETPLHLVGNRVELAALLLAAKANINARVPISGNDFGKTPLAVAVTGRHAEMVEYLLKNGADPNIRYGSGADGGLYTPLTAAIEGNNNPDVRIIRMLLDNKADPNAMKGNGYSPLHLATIFVANKAVVELLLKHGADVEIRDREKAGNTPLGWLSGGREIVELLLDHKANPNTQNNEGNTPLHRLAEFAKRNDPFSNQKELAELLIARGADVNLRNRQGLTPLNLFGVPAQPSTPSAVELAEVLRKHGAKDEQLGLAADPDSIRVWRKGMTVGRVVFVRDEAGHNRFTLMEALLNFYSMRYTPATSTPQPVAKARPIRTGSVQGASPPASGAFVAQTYSWAAPAGAAYGGTPGANYDPVSEFAFPDLTRIRVLRQEDAAKERKVISVNLINAAGIVLCANDVLLEFGDIIEIPEREYRLDEGRSGPSSDQNKQLSECVLTKVEIVVKGETKPVKLYPQGGMAYLASTMKLPHVRSLLRSTSDLSRLRITRRADPATQQSAKELTIDLEAFQRSGKQTSDDLWLRDGDVIEVPERE